ncbi:MAG: hypothetical protein ABSF98_16740, partial [Bryobacteraceae bacterium]
MVVLLAGRPVLAAPPPNGASAHRYVEDVEFLAPPGATSAAATLTVNSPQGVAPTAVSVTPNAGAGTSQSFTFQFSSVNGYGYLKSVYMLFNATLSSINGCKIEYQQSTNGLYLYTDSGGGITGPVTPGVAGTLSNSQCSVNTGTSSVSGVGDTLSLDVAVSFTASFAGLKNVYGYADDEAGLNSAWQALGTWYTATPQPPAAVSVTPNAGAGTSQSFTFQFSSASGYGYLKTAYMLFNATLSSIDGCKVEYQQSTNRLYLYTDPGTGITGPATPGVAGTLSNSQCTLNAGASSVSGAGNTLSLDLAVSFTGGFAGPKNVYGYAADNGGLNSGWQMLGTWYTAAPQAVAPAAVSVTPNSGAGTSQSFTFQFSSVNGYGYLKTAYMLFNATLSSISGCKVEYQQSTNHLYLYTDGGSGITGPVTPGVAGALSNSQCTVNAASSSVSGSVDALSLDVAVSFTTGFAGLKNVYGYVSDSGGLNSGWQMLGTWNTSAPTSASCANMSTGADASLNGFVPFPSTNAWNTDISSAPLDPNNYAITSAAGFAGLHLHHDFSSVAGGNYGIPYVVVDSSSTPLV